MCVCVFLCACVGLQRAELWEKSDGGEFRSSRSQHLGGGEKVSQHVGSRCQSVSRRANLFNRIILQARNGRREGSAHGGLLTAVLWWCKPNGLRLNKLFTSWLITQHTAEGLQQLHLQTFCCHSFILFFSCCFFWVPFFINLVLGLIYFTFPLQTN